MDSRAGGLSRDCHKIFSGQPLETKIISGGDIFSAFCCVTRHFYYSTAGKCRQMIYADMQKGIHADKKLLYEELTYQVRRALFSVYNELGFGHKERVYQKALAKEFTELQIPFKRESSVDVKYKGEHVGNYRPDFVVDNKVLLEIKAVNYLPKDTEAQLLHYLKSTNFKLGLLVNFGPRLYIRRLVFTKYPRRSASNRRKSLV